MATSGASLDNIYSRLSSAPEYHPFNADTFSDWSMEAGDIIRVSRDGKHYDSPVHTSQMTWRGQSQISVSSDGNEKRESIAKATKRKYGRGGSGYRNDNHLWQELLDDYNGLYSFFEVTSSRMFVTFSGMYDGLSSDFEVTRSRMYVDFQGMYDGLSSEFEVTRSRMRVEFRGMYDGLSSDFEVTRSRMAADFQGKYDGLASSFEVTRSRMAADFQGKYDGLSSEFEVTRSRFHVEMVDSYNQLSSGIEAAASYTMMYTQGRTSRAYIMTQINSNTGQTEALINADQILIGTSGSAKVNLANVITLGDSSTVLIKKDVVVNETYGANGVKLSTDGTIRGHQLTLIKTGGQEGQYAVKSITSDDIDEMVVKAAIDGNTLRLWKRGANLEATSGDGIINFSKAVTLSGVWSDGISTGERRLVVSPDPANGPPYDITLLTSGSWTRDVYNGKVRYYYGTDDENVYDTGLVFSISRATTLAPYWSGSSNARRLQVTADPQTTEAAFDITLIDGGSTRSGKVYTGTIKYYVGSDDETTYSTGLNYRVEVPYEDTYWTVNNINRTAPDGFTKVTSNGQVYYTADNTSGANKGLRIYMAPKITVDGIEFNTDSAHQVYFASLPTQIWADAYAAGAAAATVVVTAGTSAITWDSTNKKFYNYGYAYVNGGSQPEATSPKRESSVVSLDTSASWSNGSKSIVVKHGSTNIINDSVAIPASSGTTWENPSGNNWRARLTIGGAYRYSDNHVFYTQSEYNAALATVPSGYTAKSATTITNGNINAASIGVYSGHYACNMSLTLNFGDGTTRSADVTGGVIVDDIVAYGQALGGGCSHSSMGKWYYTRYQLPSGLWHHQLVLEQSGTSVGGMSPSSSYTIYR